MLKMLSNLTKAAVSVAAAVPAVVVDTVMLPIDAVYDKDAFSRTGKLLGNASDCVNEAVKPERDDT